MDTEYLNKLYVFLLEMKPLTRCRLIDLTDDSKKFTEAVKYLMDYHPEIRESVEFENDYSGIRKLDPWPETQNVEKESVEPQIGEA